MAGGLNDIIAKLEEQKSAIERALSALHEIEGTGAQSGEETPSATRKVRAKRKGGISTEGRKRLAEAMKRRWAMKRTAVQAKKQFAGNSRTERTSRPETTGPENGLT